LQIQTSIVAGLGIKWMIPGLLTIAWYDESRRL
jgi:hypothetical protein